MSGNLIPINIQREYLTVTLSKKDKKSIQEFVSISDKLPISELSNRALKFGNFLFAAERSKEEIEDYWDDNLEELNSPLSELLFNNFLNDWSKDSFKKSFVSLMYSWYTLSKEDSSWLAEAPECAGMFILSFILEEPNAKEIDYLGNGDLIEFFIELQEWFSENKSALEKHTGDDIPQYFEDCITILEDINDELEYQNSDSLQLLVFKAIIQPAKNLLMEGYDSDLAEVLKAVGQNYYTCVYLFSQTNLTTKLKAF